MATKTVPKYDFLIKLLLIGDSGVGKSCMLIRFCEDNFVSSFITTIGIDFKIKTIEIDGKKIKLQVWDTAGQERFKTITTAYYRGSSGIMLVYDVTDETSFSNVRNWIKNAEMNTSPGVCRMLVGNKCEDPQKRVVSEERGRKLAKEYGIPFFETSAKSEINIDQAFYTLTKMVKDKMCAEASSTTANTSLHLENQGHGCFC